MTTKDSWADISDFNTSVFDRLVVDWLVENIIPNMTPHRMLFRC